jgi:hypothetical protein
MPDFDYHRFHRRRTLIKTTGWVLLCLGIFVVIDMFFRAPVPLRGLRGLFAGISVIVLGALCLWSGYKLPVTEALEIIHRRGRGISASELIHEMRVDKLTANRIIEALLQKGFLRSSSGNTNAEQVYDVVR